MIFVVMEKERNMGMANCENCIKSDVCKYYEPKSTVACERYSEPVRHGHWITMGDCGVTSCSCCGWNIEECIEDEYCRECGAKMDGNKIE